MYNKIFNESVKLNGGSLKSSIKTFSDLIEESQKILSYKSRLNFSYFNKKLKSVEGGAAEEKTETPLASILLIDRPDFLLYLQDCNLIIDVAKVASNSIILLPHKRQQREFKKYYEKFCSSNNLVPYAYETLRFIHNDKTKFPWNNYILKGYENQRIDMRNDIDNAYPITRFTDYITVDKNGHKRYISYIDRSQIKIYSGDKNSNEYITCEYICKQQNGVYLFEVLDDKDLYFEGDDNESSTKEINLIAKTMELMEIYGNAITAMDIISKNAMMGLKTIDSKHYNDIYMPDNIYTYFALIDKIDKIPKKLNINITDDDCLPNTSISQKKIISNMQKVDKKYNHVISLIKHEPNNIIKISHALKNITQK